MSLLTTFIGEHISYSFYKSSEHMYKQYKEHTAHMEIMTKDTVNHR